MRVWDDEVYGCPRTGYPESPGKGQGTGQGLPREPTSVLIKRLLTTSFLVHAKTEQNKKGFYNIGFPETLKYFKEVRVTPGYICFFLHQSGFNIQV